MSLSTPRDAASPTPATTSSKPPLISELSIYSVVLGDQLMKPNYPSLHREDLLGGQKTIGVARLYVCPRCFKYTIEVVDHIAHWDYCKENLEIPGLMIYESADQSIYEFDGTNEWLFAQNLCLFAKLFIETKSVCYDVSTFLYYLLVKAGKHGPEIVGFFSKEKLSWDNNNLACIVVFPPWLKQGLGQVLMAASYALSQRDGRLGGPERPLSVLGQNSYLRYWAQSISSCVMAHQNNRPLTIQEICDETYIMQQDVVDTLSHMGVLGNKRLDDSITLNKAKIRNWLLQNNVAVDPILDPDGWVENEE